MVELEKVQEDLKKILSVERYNHSVGAMKSAGELAEIYGEDVCEAKFAGLIHDIAKEMSKEDIESYAKEHNIEFDEIEKVNPGLLHGKLGASIAKEKYGASEKVQNAIKYHTVGNVNMDTLAKIIFVADEIEETRDYEGVDKLREISKNNLDEAMLFTIDYNITKCVKTRKTIHPDSINLRNYLLKRLTITQNCIKIFR